MKRSTIKLQCVGCKTKRDITAEEAAKVVDVSICPKCGMPEVVISATSRA